MRCSHEPCVSRTCESWSLFSCDHGQDRKSTRLNSSHLGISYAVFCLKKKHENCVTAVCWGGRYQRDTRKTVYTNVQVNYRTHFHGTAAAPALIELYA